MSSLGPQIVCSDSAMDRKTFEPDNTPLETPTSQSLRSAVFVCVGKRPVALLLVYLESVCAKNKNNTQERVWITDGSSQFLWHS